MRLPRYKANGNEAVRYKANGNETVEVQGEWE